MTTYKLPPAFYFDHIGRDLPGGTIVRQTQTHVYVDLTESDYSELLSDAEFYQAIGAGGNGFGFEYAGLVRSAAATVKALQKQGEPA